MRSPSPLSAPKKAQTHVKSNGPKKWAENINKGSLSLFLSALSSPSLPFSPSLIPLSLSLSLPPLSLSPSLSLSSLLHTHFLFTACISSSVCARAVKPHDYTSRPTQCPEGRWHLTFSWSACIHPSSVRGPRTLGCAAGWLWPCHCPSVRKASIGRHICPRAVMLSSLSMSIPDWRVYKSLFTTIVATRA